MSNYSPDDEKNATPEEFGPHESLAGKKVDADQDVESDQPEDDENLITQESQKGKKVDGDPEEESDQPTAAE